MNAVLLSMRRAISVFEVAILDTIEEIFGRSVVGRSVVGKSYSGDRFSWELMFKREETALLNCSLDVIP